ncbi:MAG: tRNA (adenosine(37)-N6)-dimethylallyltransferase MiaA [Thermoleophilaceae bacterium]|nr:tRNA (adenosine(37)-N6)-dimethylallyltransferase MiaA [Thermoleophilaceae bacterium]
MPDPAVVAIFGPTGIGKTAVAVALAGLLRERGEDPVAVSADALQVYRGLEALTGAATADERAQLEHRLIGFVPISERFSVGDYAQLAHAEIDGLLGEGRRPIVVGGTGLYLRAALANLSFERPAPGESSELWSEETRHPTLLCGLVMERTELYERIEERVDAIVAAGAEAQARAADAGGASRTSRKALGFQELLEGDIHGLKRRTRNYARRQLTWMRKMPGVLTIDVTGRTPSCVADEIAAALP